MISLLSSEILVADKPIRDDAFEIWLRQFRECDDVFFEFGELFYTLKMIQQNGVIKEGKSYYHFTYDWDGEEYFFNASETFDNMNLKHCFYPPYMRNRIIYL